MQRDQRIPSARVDDRDVAASLRRWMGNSGMGNQLKLRLASMDVVDDRTIRLVLNQRFGLLRFMLAGAGAPMRSAT